MPYRSRKTLLIDNIFWHVAVALVILASSAQSQEYGARLGTVQRGGQVSFEPTGPGVLFDALDPVVKRWFVPQELYAEYRWKQWEYSNYARTQYQRYVSTAIEGNYFYDAFGNFLTRGWLIYDWREENPQPFGSSIFKSGQFASWFNRLVIGSDHKGQYHYAITVGDEIRTTLTPLTFSKPKFNGLQWDFSSDKYEATLLLSRISAPNAEVGGTFVNAFQSNTQNTGFGGDVFTGELSGPQNFAHVTEIQVRISDDSPEDGDGGGALFASDIIIYDLKGVRVRGSEIGFRALLEGGFERAGFLAADGNETIIVRFDFNDPSYIGPDPSEIGYVTIELVVANDYLIEVSSDRQLGPSGFPAFLPMTQARGNVMDSSNQRVITFDYGLPTANQILGFTIELDDLAGFSAYGEFDSNWQYRKYPNMNLDQHHGSNKRAEVWALNLSKQAYPYFLFGEAFALAPEYNTAMPLLDREGERNYSSSYQRFEFVEDNDDQDQFADWFRKGSGQPDREVFPGWDENNDFISDFNQNDNEDTPNLEPDYEEPFLRYDVDRPEFLYGVDMNHNRWIDRFENDALPDYPYRKDQKGLNAYGGAFIGPDIRLTFGHQRMRQYSSNNRSKANYLLITADKEYSGIGRVRLFQDIRRVKDNIADDLFQCVQMPNTRGNQRFVADILPAQNTWINTTWLGFDYVNIPGIVIENKLKWQLYRQLGSNDEVELRGARRRAGFFGLINKTEHRAELDDFTILTRWKSELRLESPVERNLFKRRELSQIAMLLARKPVMRRSYVETGLEYHWFNQLQNPPPAGADEDFTGLVLATELTNVSEYQGYGITTIIGFDIDRRSFQVERPRTQTRGFVTLYAGVQQ